MHCRDRYIVLPLSQNNALSVAGMLKDANRDGIYDTVEAFIPKEFTKDPLIAKTLLAGIIKYFAFAKNVHIENSSFTYDDTKRTNLLQEVSDMLDALKNVDLIHIIPTTSVLPDVILEKVGIGETTGNMNVMPGELIQPASTIPVILEHKNKNSINKIISAIKNKETVFKDYGLDKVLGHNGLCFLFYGPSGTGKTQAVKYIASELKKPLLIVDHSQLLEKYVGETEKRIKEVFQYAEQNDCLLLFDEADSLINSRAYAERTWEISKVNVILQYMENSKAITFFATNFADNLDPAVNRRLLFKIKFGLPDMENRKEIWKVLLPATATVSNIDFETIAKLEMTGGEIKNAIIRAILDCAPKKKITTKILLDACRTVISERLVDLYKQKNVIGFNTFQKEQA